MTRDQLVIEIEKTFSGLSRPDDKYILLHEGNDLWVESFLGGSEQSWTEISPDKIEYENSALTCMGPDSYAYYLAAYMVWCLKHYDVSDSSTIDHTIYNLNSCGYDSNSKLRLEESYRTLTLSQSASVLSYLRYMANLSVDVVDSGVAQEAIECYWHQFAKTST